MLFNNTKQWFFILPLSAWISPTGLLITLCLVSGNVQAMWVGLSQAELVENSELIVKATYIGESSVSLSSNADAKTINFGVLKVSEVLKGDAVSVVLLRVPDSKSMLKRSDEIFFKPGQTGLWFLHRDKTYEGVYLADHPNRFSNKENTEKVRKLLKNQ